MLHPGAADGESSGNEEDSGGEGAHFWPQVAIARPETPYAEAEAGGARLVTPTWQQASYPCYWRWMRMQRGGSTTMPELCTVFCFGVGALPQPLQLGQPHPVEA